MARFQHFRTNLISFQTPLTASADADQTGEKQGFNVVQGGHRGIPHFRGGWLGMDGESAN
jgi:hypothetical protein